ncbi:hypothetical protein Mapa_013536 [Marchantia paleacea]|nr:hypothetical protein Mapa_013536 [Marchantia paleacea]
MEPHVLLISFSSQAHIASCFRLGEALACRGVTVTFVTLSKHISQIRKVYTDEQLKSQRINLVGLDGVEKGNIFQKAKDFEESFKPYFEELLRNQKAGKAGPTCLMADRFLYWTKVMSLTLLHPHCILSLILSRRCILVLLEELIACLLRLFV